MWGKKGKRWASDAWLKPHLNRKNQNGFGLADAKNRRTKKVAAQFEVEEGESERQLKCFEI